MKKSKKNKNSMAKETGPMKALMFNAVRQAVQNKGYSVFGGKKSITTKNCPRCGARSLVGSISDDKEYILSICCFRYHKHVDKRCMYVNKRSNVKAETDRKKAADIVAANVGV